MNEFIMEEHLGGAAAACLDDCDLQVADDARQHKHRREIDIVAVEAGDDLPQQLPGNYTWMTLRQINQFLRFNNYLNIQSRSILSTLKYSK